MTHDHHSGECHDPDCACHDHDHGHGHDHHHHSPGEEIAENALVISRTGHLCAEASLSPEQAAERVGQVLLTVAGTLAVGGIVPGHLKARLEGGGSACTLSVTRTDRWDVQYTGDDAPADRWELTVNIISVTRPERDVAAELDELFC